MKYDVIVVGAGPGGASAGYHLSRRGLKTMILEKKKLPRHKPCAGGLTRRALDVLPPDVDEVIEDYPRTLIVNVENRRVFRRTVDHPVLATVRRDKFDFYLVRKATEAGADLREGAAFQSLRGEAGNLEVVTSGGTFKTRIVVGADGVNSRVARALGLRVSTRVMTAMEGQIFFQEDDPRALERAVQFDLGFMPQGYAWIFPKGDHFSVGVYSTSRRIRNLKPFFMSYLRMKGLPVDRKVKLLRSHLIPSGPGRKDLLGDERGLLVGDATGFADPLTGEGIFYALRGAEIASQIITNAFSLGYEHMTAYNRALKKAFLSDLTWARGMAYVLYQMPLVSHGLLKSRGNTVAEHQLRIIAGKGAYSELWRRLFRSVLGGCS